MQTQIDEHVLMQLAKLANLECSFQELQTFGADLDRIASFFASLERVSTEDIACVEKGSERIAPLRDDLPSSFDADSLLKLAPERIGDLYRVPPVFSKELSS